MNPNITIVIPNYNDLRIKRALKSLAYQSFQDFELIIVDGDSSDKALKGIYLKYKDIIDLLIIEKDNGLFDALNKGIQKALGNYIFLMGSDDSLFDNHILEDVNNEINQSKLDGYSIGAKFFNSDYKIIRKWKPASVTQRKIKWCIFPPHFSLFLSKRIYKEVGLFDLSTVGADSCWLLKFGLKNYQIKVIPNQYLYMEIGGTSTGSLINILIGLINLARSAKELGYTNWYILPIIKIIVKIPQFIIAKIRPETIDL